MLDIIARLLISVGILVAAPYWSPRPAAPPTAIAAVAAVDAPLRA